MQKIWLLIYLLLAFALSAGGCASTEPAYEYETKELYAERDGKQIYGVIYVPNGAGEQMPAVIFSHGFVGNYQVGAQYAQELAAHGYVDSDNLFLMGTSQGGAVSAITGAAHKEEIRGMVLLYPAFVMTDHANEMYQSVDEIPETSYFLWMEVGRAYFEPLIGYDFYEEIAAYDKDVLLIHGDADDIVPLSYSEKALEVYPSAELKVIPGGGHGFYEEDARQTTDYMLEYLDGNRV